MIPYSPPLIIGIIKQDAITTMNIIEIKSTIATLTGKQLLSLDMGRQMDKDKTGALDEKTGKVKLIPTEWFAYWDNTNRIRVVMHEEVFTLINNAKKSGNIASVTGLALKPVTVVTPDGKASYQRFVVITPQIDASF